MKRHPLFVPLSQDHHHSLALCLRILREPQADHLADIRSHFAQLLPHFDAEERTLAPLWPGLQREDLQTRFEQDHARLRQMHAQLPEQADTDWQTDFALLLRDHARFEERELFPAVEPLLEAV